MIGIIECSSGKEPNELNNEFEPVEDSFSPWLIKSDFLPVTNESKVEGSKSKPEGSKYGFECPFDMSSRNNGQLNNSWCSGDSNFNAVENPIDFTSYDNQGEFPEVKVDEFKKNNNELPLTKPESKFEFKDSNNKSIFNENKLLLPTEQADKDMKKACNLILENFESIDLFVSSWFPGVNEQEYKKIMMSFRGLIYIMQFASPFMSKYISENMVGSNPIDLAFDVSKKFMGALLVIFGIKSEQLDDLNNFIFNELYEPFNSLYNIVNSHEFDMTLLMKIICKSHDVCISISDKIGQLDMQVGHKSIEKLFNGLVEIGENGISSKLQKELLIIMNENSKNDQN